MMMRTTHVQETNIHVGELCAIIVILFVRSDNVAFTQEKCVVDNLRQRIQERSGRKFLIEFFLLALF